MTGNKLLIMGVNRFDFQGSRSIVHVTEVLSMEGAVLWADHIQAIHSQRLILRSLKLLGQLENHS